MPASGIKLVDANVWLALAFSDHIHHEIAARWFEAQLDGACAICRLTQPALLRHLTNSKIMGQHVQSQQQAWNAYDALAADPRVTFLSDSSAIEVEFRTLTQSSSPSHKQWTDAYLAAMAQIHGAQLVTFDRGFTGFVGLDVAVLA